MPTLFIAVSHNKALLQIKRKKRLYQSYHSYSSTLRTVFMKLINFSKCIIQNIGFPEALNELVAVNAHADFLQKCNVT